jgi:protein phosphatase
LAIAVKNGEISVEEARNSPSRHLLLAAVTGDPIHRLDYSATGRSVAVGDILIIASDGLDSLDNQEIDEILNAQSGVEIGALSQHLLEAVAAKDRPRQDNATVIVARAVKLLDTGKRVP